MGKYHKFYKKIFFFKTVCLKGGTSYLRGALIVILAKNGSKLAIWLDVCNSLFKGLKYLKNLKVGVFEIDFKQVPFVFRQTTCIYSESW